jgi:hypothetical protein
MKREDILDMLEVIGDDATGEKARADVREAALIHPDPAVRAIAKSLYVFGTVLGPLIANMAKGDTTVVVDFGIMDGPSVERTVKDLTGKDIKLPQRDRLDPKKAN